MKIFIPLVVLLLLSSFAVYNGQTPLLAKSPQKTVAVVEKCTFPPARMAYTPPSIQAPIENEDPGVVIEVARNDTLTEILARKAVMPNERFALSKAVAEYFDLKRLRPGHKIEILLSDETDSAGKRCVERFRLMTERDSYVELRHTDHATFMGQKVALQHTTATRNMAGTIHSSFFLSAQKNGVPREIFTEFYSMLSSRVDFQREIRKGDSYSIVYEENDDSPLGGVHAGRLLYASLALRDKTIGYYRHTTLDGYSGFFDENGESVDTRLLKTPLSSGHLSSLFGNRKHPVLGYKRMHKGIDFSAPMGTPVLAAGDGVVDRIGRYGNYGKYIRIRHGSKYATSYAHLSRYAKGMKPGMRVSQGTVIGYVGRTGLTTGPNLHYEVTRSGKHINPMTLELPPVRTLQGVELRRFKDILRGFELPVKTLSV